MYEPQASGSAVYLWDGKIITNAHVVVGEDENPYNYYEVCRTYSFREKPACISVANLKHYDTQKDIAYLTINSSALDLWPWVSWTTSPINIGDSITVLGYPGTGWETITLSEGKISGYVDGYYKTDSDIDAGNSWGGVFNSIWDFVWIPTLIVSDAANLGYIIGIEDILSFISNAQSSANYSVDITKFRNLWNEHKQKLRNTGLISIPGMQIRNPEKFNYEVVSYQNSGNGLSEYFLKSTRWATYVEVWNMQVLESQVRFLNIWDGLESNSERKIITRELTLWGNDLTLLAYIDLITQNIEMYFYSESTSFSIYGNMTESTAIIDALKMLISNTDILQQQAASLSLEYSWFQLTTQDQLFSTNEIENSTLSNHTEISGTSIDLSFEVLQNASFQNSDSTYEEVLAEYTSQESSDEEDYILNKSEIVRNTKWETFILSEYISNADNARYISLIKYSSFEWTHGYYYAFIAIPEDDFPSIKTNLITFFDTLTLKGTDPLTLSSQDSLKSVQQFFE